MHVQKLYEAGEHGYYTFRIPALVATSQGTLLAFCEARRGRGGDYDPIDILLRRSLDGGRTWHRPQVMVKGGDRPTTNSTPIVDRATGAVHFMYQFDYRRVYYRRSDDDGVTWSEPRDITAVFEAFRPEYSWRLVCPGPGHAIQLENGRLVVPIWMSTGEGTEFGPGKPGHRPSAVSVVYSDDHGATWRRGEIVVNHSEVVWNPSETVAIQLHDGRVMLNIRSESPQHLRVISFSADGATGWSAPRFHEQLFEPVCMASMIRLSEAPHDKNRILFANPDSRNNPTPPNPRWGGRPRENLSLKLSYDEGAIWPVNKVLDPGVAGYSDLAVGPDGTIYCLYEGGAAGGNMFHNTHLSIARFDLDWLTDGRDHLSGLS